MRGKKIMFELWMLCQICFFFVLFKLCLVYLFVCCDFVGYRQNINTLL